MSHISQLTIMASVVVLYKYIVYKLLEQLIN